ncbi:XRE family transcriptional regulator [Candidatus Latescibacterota bacterium]
MGNKHLKGINERILEIRKTFNLSQLQLAELLETTQSNLSRIEKGLQPISSVYISLLETKLNVNKKWLIQGQKPIFNEKIDLENLFIPVIKEIPEGPWKEWIDSTIMSFADNYVAVPQELKGKKCIGIQVDDESMEPLLHIGEILVIDLHKKFRDGLAVIRQKQGHKIRNVSSKSKRKYYLCPLNSKYKVEEITADNNTHFYIPVKVISVKDIS